MSRGVCVASQAIILSELSNQLKFHKKELIMKSSLQTESHTPTQEKRRMSGCIYIVMMMVMMLFVTRYTCHLFKNLGDADADEKEQLGGRK